MATMDICSLDVYCVHIIPVGSVYCMVGEIVSQASVVVVTWFKTHKSHKLQYSLSKTTKQKDIVRVLFTFCKS